MKKEIFENVKFVAISYGAIIGFILAFLLINTSQNTDAIWLHFNEIFNFTLFVIGIALSGMAFTNFRSKERTISFLTMPASHLEKTLTQLLLTSVGVVISYAIVFFMAHLLYTLIGKMFFSFEIGTFNPFNTDTYKTVYFLVLIQSIFLAGASFFKKIPVFFTGLYIFIIGIVIILIVGLLINYFGGNHFYFDSSLSYMHIHRETGEITLINNLWSAQILIFFLKYLLAPIFWTITYFNVKEKEI